MNPEEIRLLIEDAVRRAVRPLEDELHGLRLEVTRLKGSPQTSLAEPEKTITDAKPEASIPVVEAQNPPNPAANPVVPDPPVEVPPERTDFARFLQRGLQQEAEEYTEDKMKDAEPKKKAGWNPFKR